MTPHNAHKRLDFRVFSRAATIPPSGHLNADTRPDTASCKTHGQNKRPRHKHDRSQSKLDPTNPQISRPQNPSKIQVNVLFVLSAIFPPQTLNHLIYWHFPNIPAHSTLHVSFFRP